MPKFTYKAVQANGTVSEGTVDAGGRREALRQIEGQGLKALKLIEGGATNGSAATPGKATAGAGAGMLRSKKISFSMLENFTRLLSSLLAAGVPLSRALVVLHRESSNPTAKAKWKEIHDLVVDGVSLTDAMARNPETFPRVYVAMVEAGEAGGFLDVVLGQIADFQAREKELRAKVTAALIYPVVLLGLALAVLVFLMVFFIPRFQTLFEGFDAALPMLTQVIVSTSHVMRSYGLVILAAVIGIGWFARTWFHTDIGRRKWETILLRLPAVGPLLAKLATARFCRMLGTLLGAGVPLINGLNVARRSIGYQTLVDAVTTSIDRVKKGDALSASLADCPVLFSGSTTEMISVAEESGRLDQELVRLAASTESDLDRQLKMAVSLAEPLMLFVIAGFIGTIFVGMVIPIFTIQDYIK